MSYYEDELALREAQINRKRKRNRKRLLVGAGVAAGGALALNNDKIRNKVTNHLRSDSQMMNNIGNGVRKVGKGIYNNFKPSATTMSIRRGTERAADTISNYTPKYNKRRRKLANIIDDLYHSGYSDGYYDGMELYHEDTEMTDEERKARRRRRRRNIALGVAGVAGAGAAGYAVGRALRKRRGIVPTGSTGSNGQSGSFGPRPTGPRLTGPSASNGLRLTGSNGSNVPRLPAPKTRAHRKRSEVEEMINWDFKKYRPIYRDVRGFKRNPGSYRFDPNKDFGGFLTLKEMHRKARSRNYKHN